MEMAQLYVSTCYWRAHCAAARNMTSHQPPKWGLRPLQRLPPASGRDNRGREREGERERGENGDFEVLLGGRRPQVRRGGGMTLSGGTTATHAYGEASYWDQRYRQDQGPFDWYQKYAALRPLLDLYLGRSRRVLLVGCGNSVLGEEMIDDGYKDVVNIDISSVVIEAMQKKYLDRPEMNYIKMDVRDMSIFESNSFDGVIDKGTLDSLMCGHNAQQNATKMLEEVDRILKDKGVYILITYGDPKYRLYLLKALSWWHVNLHIIDCGGADRPDKGTEEQSWDLTKPVPLNEDGSVATSVLGSNPEIHYIYVCIKKK
ncbi:hypothetical protein Taro_041339 [Colocasia esculenta]|uniref:Methyltransferase type 11 domain-containing protein n=1 Tax=Colocasia esculenta TaxID=4460 RepID=A0A843WVK7_COLES|nr:hypothetical protein [Colocasia esculenta]